MVTMIIPCNSDKPLFQTTQKHNASGTKKGVQVLFISVFVFIQNTIYSFQVMHLYLMPSLLCTPSSTMFLKRLNQKHVSVYPFQELPQFKELIFEDFSHFILVENIFEEVILQSVTKDIMMGKAIPMLYFLTACFFSWNIEHLVAAQNEPPKIVSAQIFTFSTGVDNLTWILQTQELLLLSRGLSCVDLFQMECRKQVSTRTSSGTKLLKNNTTTGQLLNS